MTVKIYLAGPITPASFTWRNLVTKSLKKSRNKFTIYNPEKHEVQRNPSSIVNTDLNLIKRSDIVLVNITKLSAGTSMEMVYAHQYNKIVLTVCPEQLLSPWHIFHSTRVLGTLSEATRLIIDGAFDL